MTRIRCLSHSQTNVGRGGSWLRLSSKLKQKSQVEKIASRLKRFHCTSHGISQASWAIVSPNSSGGNSRTMAQPVFHRNTPEPSLDVPGYPSSLLLLDEPQSLLFRYKTNATRLVPVTYTIALLSNQEHFWSEGRADELTSAILLARL
jgi:hypothetical protein